MTRRPIDWDAQPLGREPDAAIARRLHVSRTAVRAARVARGISSAAPPPSLARTPVPKLSVPLADLVLAKKYGLKFYAAFKFRPGGPWTRYVDGDLVTALAYGWDDAFGDGALESGVFVKTPLGDLLYWTNIDPDLLGSGALTHAIQLANQKIAQRSDEGSNNDD